MITSKADVSCTPIGPPLLKSRPPLQIQASNTTNIRVPDRGLKVAGAAYTPFVKINRSINRSRFINVTITRRL
ncbi:hypothetical protein TNCV_3722701 [Trichonephila clavipes]|nr:hypothetical protein TNCV_3722701 [Trichonephila clavipes]